MSAGHLFSLCGVAYIMIETKGRVISVEKARPTHNVMILRLVMY